MLIGVEYASRISTYSIPVKKCVSSLSKILYRKCERGRKSVYLLCYDRIIKAIRGRENEHLVDINLLWKLMYKRIWFTVVVANQHAFYHPVWWYRFEWREPNVLSRSRRLDKLYKIYVYALRLLIASSPLIWNENKENTNDVKKMCNLLVFKASLLRGCKKKPYCGTKENFVPCGWNIWGPPWLMVFSQANVRK